MATRCVAMMCLVTICTVLCGCGSSGTGAGPGPVGPGDTVSLGTLKVGTGPGSQLETLSLDSPAGSRIAFTALYHANIVSLSEMGYAKIAFMSHRDGNAEIYTMNSDGSAQTRLTDDPAADTAPAWSPDGEKIAFWSTRDGNAEIYVMDADGSGQTNLTNAAADDLNPKWSPDGQTIAFTATRTGNGEVFVMDDDGMGQTNLTENGAWEAHPAWSPDGRKIAFVSNRLGDFDIWTMNADGSGQSRLTSAPGDDLWPAWSPDGGRIAFHTTRDGNYEIYVMDADGSGEANLTDHPSEDKWAAWRPDGQTITFDSPREGNFEVYAMAPDGTGIRNLTNHRSTDGIATWCPTPSVKRCLIGAAGNDGGSDPPFGSERPLAVVGMTSDGLVSAATVQARRAHWAAMRVESLGDIGTDLAGLKILAREILNVQEDMGRGLPPKVWDVSGATDAGTVLAFLSGATGKITSVIAASDGAAGGPDLSGDVAATIVSSRVVLRGSFTAAFSTADPSRNLIAGEASEVTLDGRTGEVVAVD